MKMPIHLLLLLLMGGCFPDPVPELSSEVRIAVDYLGISGPEIKDTIVVGLDQSEIEEADKFWVGFGGIYYQSNEIRYLTSAAGSKLCHELIHRRNHARGIEDGEGLQHLGWNERGDTVESHACGRIVDSWRLTQEVR